MKKTIYLAFLLFALFSLSACNVEKEQPTTVPDMANPASVFCKDKGYQLEIRTAEDGSQSGICVFPDGSQCDEWAFFKGECAVGNSLKITESTQIPESSTEQGTSEAVTDWWGVIKSNGTGAQYDDYFERQDLGQVIQFGIDALDPDIKSQIETLRDSGKIVHLYGTLVSNVPDVNGSQILVERIEVE